MVGQDAKQGNVLSAVDCGDLACDFCDKNRPAVEYIDYTKYHLPMLN